MANLVQYLLVGGIMQGKRRNLVCIWLFLLTSFAFAEDVGTLQSALNAVFDGSFASIASYVAVPRITLPGVTIENAKSNLPGKVSYNRADISQFSTALSRENATTWYEKMFSSASSTISPLSRLATAQLKDRGYARGSALLDGTIVVTFGTENTLSSWMDLLFVSDWSALQFTLDVSIIVSGLAFSQPVVFVGTMEAVGGKNTELTITCKEMRANGKVIEITPMHFVM